MSQSRVPGDIFRAYDIRGRASGVNAPLTDGLAYQIGRAYAERISPVRRAIVGGDQRSTTPSLMRAVIAGLLDGGVDVIELGRAPSPLVYWASAQQSLTQLTGGIVITASHNPPDDNGVKLLEPGGMPLLPEAIQGIAERIARGFVDRGGDSEPGARSLWDPKPEYIRGLSQTYTLARPIRIAIDPGNGVAAVTAAAALGAIGGEVRAINDNPDEPNPPHPADPQHAANVSELAAFVRDSGARIGFAFDGDGDRLGLVDGRGQRARPDQALALLAEDWITTYPGAQIQIDVKTSEAVLEHIARLGGRPVFGPVGHSLGKYAMQKRGIAFGGEASTHYFYRLDDPPHFSDDAVRTACRIAQLASRTALEPILDRLPSYPISPEVKIACPDDRKHAVAMEIVNLAQGRWSVNDIDGARIDLSTESDGAWCLIRASNTTPFLTVVVEARSEAGYEVVRRIAVDILAECGLDPSALLSQPPLG